MSTADWLWLGTTAYRKVDAFSMLWEDVELDQFVVAAAPYGGPVAMVRDHRKLLKMGMSSLKSTLDIYTSSGVRLAQVPWQNKTLVALSWTLSEQLVCMLQDGTGMLYTLHGEFLSSFSVLDPGSERHVLECHFFGAGLVVLTNDMQLIVADDISGVEPLVYPLAPTGMSPDNAPTSMAVLAPEFTNSNRVEVLLGTPDNSIKVVDEVSAEDQLLQERLHSRVTKIAVAPNGRFLACYQSDGLLSVMSASFATKVLDFDTKSSVSCLAMEWVGEDSVVLSWRQLLLVVGPYGDWMKLPYATPVHLAPEPDCCRIITAVGCELLQKVPACAEAIQRIGSTDPAAMLFDALEAFEGGDAKADENIRSIEREGKLGEAIESCIAAALAEFEPERQQPLLRAAAYGKNFCREFESHVFVDACKQLRVMNAMRAPSVGIPLTATQYDRLEPEVLVDRLVTRHLFLLAIKLCEYLNIRKDVVLVHWACEKLRSESAANMSAEDLCALIHRKLSSVPSLSYSEIAMAADRAGKRQLATLLLDFEPQAADQVAMLLSMHEEELAVQKALASGDADLVYLALLHLERAMPDDEQRFRLVSAYPEALAQLTVFYRTHRTHPGFRSELESLYARAGQPLEAGMLMASDAAAAYTSEDRQERLEAAQRLFASSRDLQFQQRATEEELELLAAQRRLEEVTCEADAFVGISLVATLTNLVGMAGNPNQNGSRLMTEAAQLAKKFKVSDKRFWALKARALASSDQWPALRVFANEKKSPIGYRPFAELCVQFGQPASEVEFYVSKIAAVPERYELYVEIKAWSKAAEIAHKLRDPEKLAQVHLLCKNQALQNQIDEWAEQLGLTR